MFSYCKWIEIFLIGLLLGGCASAPAPRVEPVRSALANVKTIAVLRLPPIKFYSVSNLAHPGIALGLLSGLLAYIDQQDKGTQLSTAYVQKNLVPLESFPEILAERLRRWGFKTTVENAPWQESGDQYNLEFANLHSNADAILVLAPKMLGFIAPDLVSDYVPVIQIEATLLAKDLKTVLYRGYHAAGWQYAQEGWRFSGARGSFPTFDALMKNPRASAEVLANTSRGIAVTIATDLRGY